MQALLFDLDGTLVDSDADHLVAFQKAFAPYGIRLDRPTYTAHIMGASNAMTGGPGMMMSNKAATQNSDALPIEGALPSISGATEAT